MRGLIFAYGYFPWIPNKGDWDDWNGTTYFEGRPSKSSSHYIPVKGDWSEYPIGLTFDEYWKLAWNAKKLQVKGSITFNY